MHHTEKLTKILFTLTFLSSLFAGRASFRGYESHEISARPVPLSFSHMIEATYGIPRLEMNLERGTYLIICKDVAIPYLTNYIDFVSFKRSQGFKTVVKPLSEFGTTAPTIKSSIEQYLQTDPMLEYVLLIGDVDGWGELPSFYYGVENDVTDQRYTHILGNDFFPDFYIGRFSVDSNIELISMINKTINYHRDPLTHNDQWLDKALIVAGNYSNTVPIPITPVWTSRWLRDRLLSYGYSQTDTVYYPPIQQGASLIQNAINSGVGLVNYRGWGDANGWHYPEFHVEDVAGLNNGSMTPVFTSFVCNSADFANSVDPMFGEALVRGGTPTVSKGAVALLGPSDLHTSTRFNNVINTYMYDAMLDQNVRELGPALMAGQMGLLTEFPQLDGPGESQETYFHVYNILGDPSLNIHLLRPETFTITVDPVNVNDGIVITTVTDSHNQPVPEAVMAVMVGDQLVARGITDVNGQLIAQVSDLSAGDIDIYANKTGFIQGHVMETASAASRPIIISDFDIEIADGVTVDFCAPGQMVAIFPYLQNTGTTEIPAGSITAQLGSGLQAQVTSVTYPAIPGNQVVLTDNPLEFRVREFGPQTGYLMNLSDGGGLIGQIIVPVIKPVFKIESLTPGLFPEGNFSGNLNLINYCAAEWTGLTVLISSTTDSLVISDGQSNAFNLTGWGSVTENGAFSGEVGAVANGSGLDIEIDIYNDTIRVFHTSQALPVIPAGISDPTPPSPYGYWAYDNNDLAYSQVPVYDWVELSGNSAAELYRLDDDDHFDILMPFDFQYFGTAYNQVTISSNGWLSFVPCDINYFWNFSIPMALGPQAQIAAFWDDLEVVGTDSIRVFTWYDAANGRFIIEWDQALNGYDEVTTETFEIILYSQSAKPTVTGDGVIDIQYLSVVDIDVTKNYCTVGIESADQNEGVQYVFNNGYAPGATPLADGLAIRFTTEAPEHYVPSLAIDVPTQPHDFALLPAYPNPLNPETRIEFTVAVETQVAISIYDLLGREVLKLTDQKYGSGKHSLQWNGTNNAGVPVSTGTYFIVAKSETGKRINKILLLK